MKCKTGITGNLYFLSEDKADIENVCLAIGKSFNAIYFNKKYSVWAIRIKNKNHKMVNLKTRLTLIIGFVLIMGGVLAQNAFIPLLGFVVFLIGLAIYRHKNKKSYWLD